MDKHNRRWSFKKHIIFVAAISIFLQTLRFLIAKPKAASIGIIGGADGPTKILISGNIVQPILEGVFPVLLFLVLLLLYKPIKRLIEK